MKVNRRRDLSVVSINDVQSLVIACDSSGSIGEKECDAYNVPSFYVGVYAARVPFMEVMCAGATVITVANNVCCEMEPTGAQLIKGILYEMGKIGLDTNLLTGSTEENFQTKMTAVGITAVGIAQNDELRFESGEIGDYFVLVGLPQFGAEMNLTTEENLATYANIKTLLADDFVKEIVPVGSKGVLFECETLAKLNDKTFEIINHDIDMKKSGGPASCLVALVAKEFDLTRVNGIVIGKLVV